MSKEQNAALRKQLQPVFRKIKRWAEDALVQCESDDFDSRTLPPVLDRLSAAIRELPDGV